MEGQQLYTDIMHSTASTTSNWDSRATVLMARAMLLKLDYLHQNYSPQTRSALKLHGFQYIYNDIRTPQNSAWYALGGILEAPMQQ
jgi:hypothetical protein